MRNFYILAVLVTFLFSACKSASKLYEKGNYNDAIDASIKKLQKNPYDGEARDVLKRSYAYAVSRHEDEIRILSNNGNENRFDQIYRQYNELQGLYEKTRRYPSIFQFLKPVDYSSYVQTYKDKAADVYFQKGLTWMEGEDKRSFREAYQAFRSASYYKPDDIEIKRKLEEAYDAALVKVLVIPLDGYNSSYYYANNSYQMRNFQDKVLRSLNNNGHNSFTRFFTESEARNKRITPDEVVEMKMGKMMIGQPYDQSSTKQVSKDVVVKEIVHGKDSTSKEYAKVNAKITTTKRTLVSEVDMFITTREPNGKILWTDNFKGEHRWQTEFATYTGDERALSESDKTVLNKKGANAPKEEEVADELLRKLEIDIASRLRNYYSRYQ